MQLFLICVETIEESSVLKSEIDRLTAENDRLRSDLAHGHSHVSSQVQHSHLSIFNL